MVRSRFGSITEDLKDGNWRPERLGSLGLLWGSKIPGSRNLSVFLLYHLRFPLPRPINDPKVAAGALAT